MEYTSKNSPWSKDNAEPGSRWEFVRRSNRKRTTSSVQEFRKFGRSVYAAGILPYAIFEGSMYLLLGKDLDGKWSDFGGRCESQDRGRWDQTATREFYEESCGAVADTGMIMSRLQNRRYYTRVRGKTLNGSPYFMYIVKLNYEPRFRDTFHSTLKFIKYANVDKKYIEKMDIQWVSLDTILASLEDERSSRTLNFPLRRVFKTTFEKNIDAIIALSKPKNEQS